MDPEKFFNPLDKKNLGVSVANALETVDEVSLDSVDSFFGAGVYAIYYRGDFEPYFRIAELNQNEGFVPIYVGKAIPKGGRKGASVDQVPKSKSLSSRLKQHAATIRSVDSLDLDHFTCRYLVVDDIWIPLGERMMIEKTLPLWNTVIDGFGNHDPGKGRYKGARPLWDELHPGRSWAEKCEPAVLDYDEIVQRISEYMERLDEARSDK